MEQNMDILFRACTLKHVDKPPVFPTAGAQPRGRGKCPPSAPGASAGDEGGGLNTPFGFVNCTIIIGARFFFFFFLFCLSKRSVMYKESTTPQANMEKIDTFQEGKIYRSPPPPPLPSAERLFQAGAESRPASNFKTRPNFFFFFFFLGGGGNPPYIRPCPAHTHYFQVP